VLNDLLYRLRSLFRRRSVEAEVEEELREHFERQVEKHLKSGLTREEATRRARIEFGGHEQLREASRDARGVSVIETFFQDIRYGVRILARTPATTSIAILSLALGIGANTAIFSLIDAVVLRMLPVRNPQELEQVEIRSPQDTEAEPSFTNPIWEQLRDHQDVFAGIFASGGTQFNLSQGGAVNRVEGKFVSGSYFGTLGVRPAAGRLITETDDKRGCAPVTVLGYAFWQTHYGGAESAIGSSLSLDDHEFRVIGVSAPGFFGVYAGDKTDVTIPICAAALLDGPRTRLDQRSWWWLAVIARRNPQVSREQEKARLAVLSPQVFAAALPPNWEPKEQQDFLKRKFETTSAASGDPTAYLRRQFTHPLNVLMGVVGLVLLIACANITSLMLARAAARHREIAVRKAVGASRARLIRQLLTECVLLSAAGALLGVFFARWGSALLVRLISTTSSTFSIDLSLDWRVLGFTAALAVFTGILFGVLPAFRSTRVSLTAAMKGSQAQDAEGRTKFRSGKWIVASQVALSLVLLVVSGLFLRSLVKLVTLDAGFDKSSVLIVEANLDAAKIPDEQQEGKYREIEDRLRQLPGVVSASRSVTTPAGGMIWNNFLDVDIPNPPTGEKSLAYFNFISPGYFETLRTPLLAGRDFTKDDTKNSPQVAVVNETLARRFFPNASALGKYFRVHPEPGKAAEPVQIVGVVKDSKYKSLRDDDLALAYFPVAQITEHVGDLAFEMRTVAAPSALIPAVEESVGEVSKAITLDFSTLAQQVDDSLVQERLLATLSTFFGALALLLAMIGLYGALSYLVAQRQAEFGIRMALGAPRTSILGLVMRDVVLVLAGGVLAGAGISLAAVGVLQKMLYGLAARDAATLLACIGVLSAVALLAGYLPARRATKVDPMVALRYE